MKRLAGTTRDLPQDRGLVGLLSFAVRSLIGWDTDGMLPRAAKMPQAPLHVAFYVNAALGLVVAAWAANASRIGNPWAVDAFYGAIAYIFAPLAYVAIAPSTSRRERFSSVILATAALYVVRVIREPTAFIDHDEFLHWTTTIHMLESGRLFSPNALLPVGPRYPGLELAATAIVSLSGLTLFQAAVCLLAAGRLVFISALFYAYERLSGNARVAACGCLIYMGSSTFLVFDTQFSYESLAVVFVAACIMVDTRSRSTDRTTYIAFVMLPLIAALAVTHHMTAYFAAAFLGAVAVLEIAKDRPNRLVLSSVVAGAFAAFAPLVWSKLMGNPQSGYLGPVLYNGAEEVARLLTFSTGRRLFVSEDGYVAPTWQKVTAVASVGLICLGLAMGFLRTLALAGMQWKRRTSFRAMLSWRDGSVMLLALLTLVYPLGLLFRLTKSGWEIGNRIGPFSFIGVAFVIAVGLVGLSSGRRDPTIFMITFTAASLVILIGGIISAEGPRILVPATFKVAADSASIETMGIDAATWTREWLGERNLFASDRINRLLLSTYGDQDVASTLQDGYDTSDVVLAPTLSSQGKDVFKRVGLQYLAVDMRITTALPGVGGYFDGGSRDHDYVRPPVASSLAKFDKEPQIGRIFDDGYLFIYDLRRLDGTR